MSAAAAYIRPRQSSSQLPSSSPACRQQLRYGLHWHTGRRVMLPLLWTLSRLNRQMQDRLLWAPPALQQDAELIIGVDSSGLVRVRAGTRRVPPASAPDGMVPVRIDLILNPSSVQLNRWLTFAPPGVGGTALHPPACRRGEAGWGAACHACCCFLPRRRSSTTRTRGRTTSAPGRAATRSSPSSSRGRAGASSQTSGPATPTTRW